MTIWEVHKCTLRGDLIKMGARHKREKEQEVRRLIEKIHSLETKHKQFLSEQSALELLETRRAIQQIFEARTKRFLFYKCRKTLLRTWGQNR